MRRMRAIYCAICEWSPAPGHATGRGGGEGLRAYILAWTARHSQLARYLAPCFTAAAWPGAGWPRLSLPVPPPSPPFPLPATVITSAARAGPWEDFDVQAVIENRPDLSDPEGSTILEDLVLRGSYKGVSGVRTARMIRFTVSAPSARAASAAVRRMCDELRIYNPLVSTLSVSASRAAQRPRRRARNDVAGRRAGAGAGRSGRRAGAVARSGA